MIKKLSIISLILLTQSGCLAESLTVVGIAASAANIAHRSFSDAELSMKPVYYKQQSAPGVKFTFDFPKRGVKNRRGFRPPSAFISDIKCLNEGAC
jgi:hypothetical protein